MDTQWIFGWWNLLFLAPFLLAVIYLGVYAASGVTFGDADTDTGFEADAQADVTAAADDVHLDHHLPAHDSHADHSGHGSSHGHAPHHPFYLAALTWLGVGRVPLSIVGMVLLMAWGAIGFGANVMLRGQVKDPIESLMFALPLALLGSIVITGIVSNTVHRLLPLHETSARRRVELLGSIGQAIYDITDSSGVVAVRDEQGNLHQVACRADASSAPIAKGTTVKLVAYNAPANVYVGISTNQRTAGAAAPAHN